MLVLVVAQGHPADRRPEMPVTETDRFVQAILRTTNQQQLRQIWEHHDLALQQLLLENWPEYHRVCEIWLFRFRYFAA